jgi:hypothetical protein
MAEVRDPASEIESAELAAGAGDFPSAEQHLSRAVELEEVAFGPMHAELASILNNLGVVYERLDRPDKAEACYRRAYAIAKASLPPGDPGIELSATNLREFCAARGIPFEPAFAQGASADKPASAPVAPGASADKPDSAHGATADKPLAKVAQVPPPSLRPLRKVEEPVASVPPKAPEPERPRAAAPVDAPAPAPLMAPRTLAMALVVVAAIVGVIFLGTRSSSPTSEPTPAPTPASAAPVQEPAPAPAVRTPEPAPAPQATPPTAPPSSPSPRATAPPKAAPAPAPPAARRERSTAPAAVPTLVSAQLCRSIETSGEWRCTPANGQVAPGSVVFYTRLKTPADTAVEHRWYRGDRLQQKMTLRIRANQGTGYRTFSRATVGAGLGGQWKVELRTMNGTVLHEERFTVGP